MAARIKRRTRRTEEQQIADLESKLAAVEERVARRKQRAKEKARPREDLPHFSPDGLAKHRGKVRLSAEDYGLLVGVSTQTIYSWEKGKSRPRAKQLEALAAVRELGQRAAWARLEEMGY